MHPSLPLLSSILSIFIQEIQALKPLPYLLPSMVFQTLPSPTTANCLNLQLSNDSDPLVIFSFTIAYSSSASNPTDSDELVESVGRRIRERVEREAKERGGWHPFVYMNYAHREQDVFSGYGANREVLREVQREWDPEGVFSRLQPGGFKL